MSSGVPSFVNFSPVARGTERARAPANPCRVSSKYVASPKSRTSNFSASGVFTFAIRDEDVVGSTGGTE